MATRNYRVMSMPSMLLFRGGEVVSAVVGNRPKSYLRRAFTEAAEPYVNR